MCGNFLADECYSSHWKVKDLSSRPKTNWMSFMRAEKHVATECIATNKEEFNAPTMQEMFPLTVLAITIERASST